jgi:hypothetical protein
LLQPGIFFGKGFGDLPDALAWLRPFAITGAVTLEHPMTGGSIDLGIDPRRGGHHGRVRQFTSGEVTSHPTAWAPMVSQVWQATARRNKFLGLWPAQKLGLSGAEADAYAKEVVLADLGEIGGDDVFRKIRKDFDAKGVKESDHQIRRIMNELMAKAIEQI